MAARENNTGTTWEVWQITISSGDRMPLVRSAEALLALVRALLAALAAYEVLLFCIVDDHAHLVVACSREVAGRIGGFLPAVVRAAGGHPDLARAWVSRVKDRSHLEGMVGYAGRQLTKHRLEAHAAEWPGACVQDLVGARVLAGFDAGRIRLWLPRWRDADFWYGSGLPPLEPLALKSASTADVAAGARAVHGVSAFSGKSPSAVAAKRLAAHALAETGLSRPAIAEVLGVSQATTRRLGKTPPPPSELRALGLQLAIRRHVAEKRRK